MLAASVYTCRVISWNMFWLNVVVLGVLSTVFWTGSVTLWQDILLAVLLLFNFTMSVVSISQRVTAGPAGLTVSLGFFGLPRVRIARASIAHAEMIHLSVTPTGGIGVFWQPNRGWFLTPKLGPALRLRLASGRNVTVAMPDPAAAMWAMGIAP